MPNLTTAATTKKLRLGAIVTKTEIEQKIAEVKAQGDALQKHNAQLIQQIEVNKVEIAKIIGKLDLLSEMLTDCEKKATEPAKKRRRKKMQERVIKVEYSRPRG